MDPEDLIFFIIILIFFIGPLLKKIMEALAGAGSPKKRARHDIKDYLEKMRKEQHRPQAQTQPRQYRPPASRPSPEPLKRTSLPVDEEALSPIEEEAKGLKSKPHREEDVIYTQKEEPAGTSLPKGEPKPSLKGVPEKIRQRILENTKFTDLQKAVVLMEIFGKSKARARQKD